MTQPFRGGGDCYRSAVWKGATLCLLEDRIEAACPERLHALSSAVHPGGFSHADRIVNWKVPLTYRCDDPVRDLIAMCGEWGCDPRHTVGLLTAAKLTHASVKEVEGDRFALLCCVTVGTRNAARAGMPRRTFPAYAPGTINTVLLIDGRMTESAMVNAVITATEAKSAALQRLGIVERATGETATGTTTDAVVVGVSQHPRWDAAHAYAGAATTIGCAIGEAVYGAVLEAGRTQHED
ncbi:adenosylcobinamide amidohydrolase [Paenibacillus arenilitoris]|uniref:Adenosylcobinamide amidohydrolase n=1 Tax=Paenibacillus arenilitoris TaxID=2772299 RepID=A0A927CPL4_9BACL|nr:adenosylcobinamide amidohydrolase [Paenibacillus arenilitoris]MBD2871185.1 adenosylcobinamide amidohydrolase [Paenibacillus arenilitoris]